MKWLKDEEFVRGSVPMSKFDIRVLALAMLEVGKGDIFVDIGAGTGSISVQAALLGAEVYAVEEEYEGVELIKKNSDKFNSEVKIIHGSAPEAMLDIARFNKCFIGGSGGKLCQIVEEVDRKLPKGGLLAASFIIPDNMIELKRILIDKAYSEIEVKLVQIANVDDIGLMKANNPIFLIKGKKA